MAHPLLILISAAALAGGAAPPASLTGTWGGDGVILTVKADGARLQADCARGEIAGALKLDARGRFTAQGGFEQFAGGPQRADEPGSPPDATYEGRVDGDTLILKVRAASNPTPRSYTLRRGAHAKLMRCL